MRMFSIVLSCLLLLVFDYRVPALPVESDLNNVENENFGNGNIDAWSRQEFNELTSYIDASAVYGSTQEEGDSLGTQSGGPTELMSYVYGSKTEEENSSKEYGSKKGKLYSLRKKNEDYSALNRERRTVRFTIGSAVLQGIKAVKKLLKGAKKLKPSDNGVKEYEKTGGFYRASMDFDKAKPKDVQPLMGPSGILGKTGKVGDREVILRDGASGARPTIEIKRTRDFKGRYVDQVTERITYRDNGYPRP